MGLISSLLLANGLLAVHVHGAEWGYAQQGADWPNDPALGLPDPPSRQSPIDLPALSSACWGWSKCSSADVPVNRKMDLLLTHYRTTEKVAFINFEYKGHNMYAHPMMRDGGEDVPAYWGTVSSNGVLYNMGKFHFHAPSEHLVEGQQHLLELHIVCEKVGATGSGGADDYLVLGVMFEEGSASPLVGDVISSFPERGATSSIDEAGAVTEFLNHLHNTIHRTGSVYRYAGSLTTPPCTEAVSWAVFHPAKEATTEQLTTMTAKLMPPESSKGNYRVVQDSTGMPVYQSKLLKPSKAGLGNGMSAIIDAITNQPNVRRGPP